MAVSMRYWALATGFAQERDRIIEPTALGHAVLADDGFDPFMERPATIWLAHWGVAATPEWTSTAYFAFNGLASIEFDAANLVDELMQLVRERGWRATQNTLKRDVEVFLRSYVRREGVSTDDAAEPLLAELGLIREARMGAGSNSCADPNRACLMEFSRTRCTTSGNAPALRWQSLQSRFAMRQAPPVGSSSSTKIV